MGQAALQYDEFEDIEPIEVPAGGIASFLTATEGSWATDDANDLPDTGIAQVKRVADQLATYGRHEDEYMIHAAEGETVIPMEVFRKNPILKDRIFQQMRDMGIEPERYVVGNELNSLNPVTGQPEFFLKKLFSGLKKFVKKAVTVVLPIVGGAFFGPLGAAAGSGIATLINGGNMKDALKSAAISGLTAGVMNGISGGMSAAGEGGSFFQGFKAGAVGEGAFTRTIGEAAAAGGAQAAEAAAAASTLEKVATDPLQTQALMTGDAAKQEAMAKALSTPKMPQIVPESTVPITPRSPLDPVNQLAGAQTSTGAGLQTGAGTTPVTMQAITKPTQAMYDANAGGLRAVVNADPGNPLYSNIQTSAGTTASTTPPIIGSDGTIDIGSDLSAAASKAPATGVGGAPTGAGAAAGAGATMGPPAPTTVQPPGVVDSVKQIFGIGPEVQAQPIEGLKNLFLPGMDVNAQAQAIAERAAAQGTLPPGYNVQTYAAKLAKDSLSGIGGVARKFGPAFGGIMALDAFTREEPEDFNVAEQVTGFDLREQNPYTYELGPGTMRLPSSYTIQDVSSQYTPIKAPVYQPVPLDVAQGGEIENFPRMNGRIDGPGTETSDDIPAMLSDGEFVFTAKAVRGAGNGSRENGMQNMYDLMSKFERMA
jgi:hypothetical protein